MKVNYNEMKDWDKITSDPVYDHYLDVLQGNMFVKRYRVDKKTGEEILFCTKVEQFESIVFKHSRGSAAIIKNKGMIFNLREQD